IEDERDEAEVEEEDKGIDRGESAGGAKGKVAEIKDTANESGIKATVSSSKEIDILSGSKGMTTKKGDEDSSGKGSTDHMDKQGTWEAGSADDRGLETGERKSGYFMPEQGFGAGGGTAAVVSAGG
ncbi:unnamed protein product, partial [Brugia timori]|uniref:Dehydrin n=1 Tax=Brugia timori TaxID=42155 RepID=A0A0R3RCQ8_9BILA